METKVEMLEGDRAKVTVTIDEQVITAKVKDQYRKLANQYNFPGFRKGKAPRPVVDSMLGKEAAVALVTDDVVNESYPLAIDETGLYPVGQPDFGEGDLALVHDKEPYTFSFEVGVKPTPELTGYGPVEIEMPPEGASDERIDEEIDTLLEHYYELVDAPANTKVKDDKFVQMKISATDDAGEDIASITSDSTEYGLGSGLYPKSFDDELVGMKKGDSKQFSIDMPLEPTAATALLAGKTSKINFDVEILQVKKKQLPELTDEWVKEKIGVETVQELRDELAGEITSAQESMFPRLKENRALAALAERLEAEVPDNLVEEAEATLLQDFFGQLQRQGLTLDVYLQQMGISSQQFRDDIKEQAAEMTKQDLALDAYAAHAGLQATDEDIRAEFEESGAADPDALMQQWRENGQMYLVRQGVLRQKAAKEVVDAAIVTEETPAEEKKGKHSKGDEPAEAAETAEAAE